MLLALADKQHEEKGLLHETAYYDHRVGPKAPRLKEMRAFLESKGRPDLRDRFKGELKEFSTKKKPYFKLEFGIKDEEKYLTYEEFEGAAERVQKIQMALKNKVSPGEQHKLENELEKLQEGMKEEAAWNTSTSTMRWVCVTLGPVS